MNEAIIDTMGAVLTRWTMGSPGAPAAAIWHAELGTEPDEAELRLLALSGQYLGVAVLADPPVELRALPDVPVLALPTLPDSLRPLVRRLLSSFGDTQSKADLVQFLAARGYAMHPADWMPLPNAEDVPDVYAPWRDWMEIAASARTVRGQRRDALTAESWDEYWPAARKAALTLFRTRDPAAARALLEARLTNEAADARLRLLTLLAIRLSDDDAPFLESLLTTDRAPKVKALAASLLGRLGRGASAGDDAAELAGFFSLKTKGLLKRSRVIELQKLKTAAQLQRRVELFETTDVASFAAALGLSPDQIIAAWPWSTDEQADALMAALIFRTGSDALVVLAANGMLQCDPPDMIGLTTLVPRLASAKRAELAATVLRDRRCTLQIAKAIAGPAASLDTLVDALAYKRLLVALERGEPAPHDPVKELHALGALASAAMARKILKHLNAAGVVLGDPRLDMLRINAALEDTGVNP